MPPTTELLIRNFLDETFFRIPADEKERQTVLDWLLKSSEAWIGTSAIEVMLRLLDSGLLQRFVSLGLGNPDHDVRGAAEDFKRQLP